jgi:Predicted metal-binding protein related to the C-terminal domain of SecA
VSAFGPSELVQMFEHEMNKCGDPDCFNCIMDQMMMEMHVIMEYEPLRRQIMCLRTAFPELYQIKRQFLEDVLDERKIESLYYKYKRKLDKMAKENPEEFEDLGTDFAEDEEEEEGAYETQQPYRRDENKVGRNDPCPCGSGKKYKKCCGK